MFERYRPAGVLAGLLLTACAPEPPEAPAGQPAAAPAEVRIIHNAVIHAVRDDGRPANAMAFSGGGEILAVGEEQAILGRFPGAERRDLQGRTVIPGLIDAHGHLYRLAQYFSRAQLVGTTSKAEIIQRLRAHAAGLGPQDWLLGRGWDQNDWPVQAFPTRADLDQHFPDRPVWLVRIDGHAGWANSAALAMSDRDLTGSWQPPGGFIHRDASGQPTGVLIDGARALVEAAIPAPSRAVVDASLDLALARLVSLGLTGVHDPGVTRVEAEHYLQRISEGRFPVRVYAMTEGTGEVLDWLCAHGGIEHRSGRLVMRAAKLYLDGALGSRGAALNEDYADEPGNRGLLFMTREVLEAQLDKVLGCGFQAAIHAIGDRANGVALDALEHVMARHPDNPGRHRIEHAQMLTATDIPRFGALGVIAAVQPTHATSDMYWAGQRVGPERIRWAYAWRALAESGARLALGSDFPVEEVNPMLGIHAAVTRQDLQGWPAGGWQAEQALDRHQALRGFTLDAAHAAFMDHRVGSLEAGKRADFVVLDRDLMQVPAADIPAVRVLETWLDGQRVYPRP